MPTVARSAATVALMVTAVALTGCGGADGRVVVKGKLVEGPKTFVLDQSKIKLPAGATALPPGSRPLAVAFTPVEGGEPAQAVVALETGTFEVPGPDGKGIKPGQYKIAITCGVGGADYFGGKFAADKTKIIRNVTADAEVVIDVSKPEG